MNDHEGSSFLRHIPCSTCGSKDNAAEFSDGHTYCFGCGAHGKGDTIKETRKRVPLGLLQEVEVSGVRNRSITDETARTFGYGYGEFQDERVQVAPYYDDAGNLVAQKIRFRNKDFKVLGSLDNALPFGARAWPRTGRMIVVTEGELDALAMSQVQGNKYPVVSIACGAGAQTRKYIAKHRDYFLGFEKVVLMFDNDEQGQEAANIAASVIGSRAAIAKLPLKDACDMLKAGKTDELIKAMWGAEPYQPAGVVDMSTLKKAVMADPEYGLSWFLEELTTMTYGIRTGEIYAFGAGTGIGKTDLFTQQVKHFVIEHRLPVAYIALEQAPAETATRIAGKIAERTFHIPDSGWTREEKEAAWGALEQGGKVFLYDSFGANDWDIIEEKIEYLVHAHGVKHVFLDHLTALAAAEDDERKALEQIMARMGSLVKRLDIALFIISHLATPEGKPHEEGGRVMIRHFKGSRAIGFWCHFMFGLERDQQHADEAVRTTTTLRCLKDRYTGRATGKKLFLDYNTLTGLLFPTTEPDTRKPSAFGFKDDTHEAPEGGPSDF